jgi:hypothetical protein
LKWNDIYDWEYAGAAINVYFYDDNKVPQMEKLKIESLDINGIGLLMLMVHFKGKYGQNTPSL